MPGESMIFDRVEAVGEMVVSFSIIVLFTSSRWSVESFARLQRSRDKRGAEVALGADGFVNKRVVTSILSIKALPMNVQHLGRYSP